MKLVYLSTALSDHNYHRLVNQCPNGAPTYSGIGFDYRVWKAISQIYDDAVAFTYVPLSNEYSIVAQEFEEPGIIVIQYDNQSLFKEVSFINAVEKKIMEHVGDTDVPLCILISGLYRVFTFAALSIRRRRRNTYIVGIAPDLPELMGGYYNRKGSFIHRLKMRIDSMYGQYSKRKLDGYVFLSQQMNSIINTKNKPYSVIEGLVNDFEIENKTSKDSPKVLLYAGKVGVRFGVCELISAFVHAGLDNCSLHIYGSGDAQEEVKKLSEGYDNIIFHGVCSHEEVLNAEKRATLLIEPRDPNEDFANYCFPSKVLEYMASGTPLIMAPLPNMNQKFLSCFIPVNNYSIETLSSVIRSSLLDNSGKLDSIGKKAQLFIKNNYTTTVQAKVIDDVIRRAFEARNQKN